MSHASDGSGSGSPGPAVGAPGERPALARVVGDLDTFARTAWGREPLVRTGADRAGFADLLSESSVDELLSVRGLRTPFLRVAKDGSTLANAAFTAPGGTGAGIADQVSDTRLTALFAGGSTIVLQALHRVWPPIIDFCQQLAADLGHPVQANAYVTPPQNQGFDDHYDVHDVFVLQVAGRKRWSIHAPVHLSPLRDQPWTDRRDAVREAARQEPVIDTVLEPGDVLYLPRGYLHSATALGGLTIHLTLGIHSWTRYAVAEELVALVLRELAEDEEARGSLPLGTDLAPADLDLDLLTSKLCDALTRVDATSLAERVRARRLGTQRPAPVGPLAQHALSSSLDPATPLSLRGHLDARLDGTTITSRAGSVPIADLDVDVAERLLSGESVLAGDLGLAGARTLIEAGLVVAG